MIPFNYAGLFHEMDSKESVLPKLDKFFTKLSGWGNSDIALAADELIQIFKPLHLPFHSLI